MNDKPKPQDSPKFSVSSPTPPHEYSEVGIDSTLIRNPAMAIWFDHPLFEKAKQIATYLSKAEGFVPPHLLGKPESCFAVVSRALAWKLDPFAVANCCYQTPAGRVGFEGKLCQAALEQSPRLEGGVKFIHVGDWDKVAGKFEIKTSTKSGKEYAVPTWTRDQAREWGLKVIVQAKLIDEDEARSWEMTLAQCFPLNSTLWATDPRTQICYTAVRRFASLAMPGLFMGVDFDREASDDDSEMVRAARARDITPAAPKREDFTSDPKFRIPDPAIDPRRTNPPADPAAGAAGPPNPSGTKEDTAPHGSSTGEDTSGRDPGIDAEDENQDAERVNVTEGGRFFHVASAHGELEFATEDPTAFTDELLNYAMRAMKNVKELNQLWDNNSAQFSHLPEAMGQRIRDQWPRVTKKAQANPNQQEKLV